MNYYRLIGAVALLAGLAWGGYSLAPGQSSGLVYIALGIGAGLAALYMEKKRTDRPQHVLSVTELTEVGPEQSAQLQGLWQKALHDYERLEASRSQLRNPALQAQIARMQRAADKLLDYLGQHPRRLPAARRFVDYYQDRAANLTEQYIELERTGLHTEKMQELRQRLESTLAACDEAYAQQMEQVVSAQMLDMDAELSVMEQSLAADGIKDDGQTTAEAAGDGTETARSAMDDAARANYGPTPAMQRRGPRGIRARRYRPTEWRASVPEEMRHRVIGEKIVLAALAILLGGFGAHKFFQGRMKKGLLYAAFCWTPIPWVIGFVEGIRYLMMNVDDFYNDEYLEFGSGSRRGR